VQESWTALHQVLRENGLEIRERGNGLVIADAAGTMVKASSVARELSRAKLEARLGAFRAFTRAVGEPGRPVDPDNTSRALSGRAPTRPSFTPATAPSNKATVLRARPSGHRPVTVKAG
jgi:hypothetical protein